MEVKKILFLRNKMFGLSLYIINKTKICKIPQTVMYSIALGLIFYSSIYVYLLFYKEEYLPVFNAFIMYILMVDLVVSVFYYYKLQQNNIISLNNNGNGNGSNEIKNINTEDSESDTDSDFDEPEPELENVDVVEDNEEDHGDLVLDDIKDDSDNDNEVTEKLVEIETPSASPSLIITEKLVEIEEPDQNQDIQNLN